MYMKSIIKISAEVFGINIANRLIYPMESLDEVDSENDYRSSDVEKKKSETEKDEKEADYSIYSKSAQNVSKDIEKGNAVRHQISMWESLLECRIKLQKALIASNKLPQVNNFTLFKSNSSHDEIETVSKTCKEITVLLQLLLTLQKDLVNLFPDFRKSTKGKTTSNGGVSIHSDVSDDDTNLPDDEASISSSIASGFSENEETNNDEVSILYESDVDEVEHTQVEPPKKLRKLEDFSKELHRQHQNFIPARNEAIQKWNDKTRISSGRIKSSDFSAFDQSTLKQIEQILSDKIRLIKRTQMKRSVYKILGSESNEKESEQAVEGDPEIFDDDDFYHKLLREFIEQKSADISNVQQMGKQWAELQKMRSKMKRPIDVKATKGRRLRYTTHSKLVNFMAPIPYNSWTDEAESELFSSLFGKIICK